MADTPARGDRSSLLTSTKEAEKRGSQDGPPQVTTLTILYHPNLSRIGESAAVAALDRAGGQLELSRTSPDFVGTNEAEPWPLADSFLSRAAVRLERTREGITIRPPVGGGVEVLVEGRSVEHLHLVADEQLERGVVLSTGGRAIVLLHRRPPHVATRRDLGLVGASRAITTLRAHIERVATTNVAVLVTGPTGVGKELVARALHAASDRAQGPFNAINMAALNPQLVGAELFGHTKGAFTGAGDARDGFFIESDGGTAFLDEIGAMPTDVQAVLLRVLENAHVRPIGGAADVSVDVRVVAASDSDLDAAVDGGTFRAPLLHRLRGYEIRVPALDERREDIGRLMVRFIRDTLAELGDPRTQDDDETSSDPWLDAHTALGFFLHTWPGNVRELKNAVRQLLIANRGADRLTLDARLRAILFRDGPTSEPAIPTTVRAELNDDRILEALRANAFAVRATAKSLGISPSSLTMHMDRSPNIRKASEIPKDELEAALRECDGNVERAAALLEVSARGLKTRIKAVRGS